MHTLESNFMEKRSFNRNFANFILLALVLVPTLTVLCAFYARIATEVVYFLGKAIVLIAPLIWIKVSGWNVREVIERWAVRPKRLDVVWGAGSGLVITAAIWVLYLLLFQGKLNASGILSTLPAFMIEHFWLAALGVSLGNSFLEEYFWRAFVLERSKVKMGWSWAILLNGLFFGLHHLFLLYRFFPLGPAALFALGTAVGGWIWCWMRMRGQSIWACYISHSLADLAIMAVGYDLLF